MLATFFGIDDDFEKIYRDTLAAIEQVSKERPLKGRYVDLETFRNLGPFIDWRGLLNDAGKSEN